MGHPYYTWEVELSSTGSFQNQHFNTQKRFTHGAAANLTQLSKEVHIVSILATL